MHSVYAIENPLMDYIMHEDYDWLAKHGAKPGTMQLVEHRDFRRIVDSSHGYQVFPGGSGANTVRALAMLMGDEASRFGSLAYSGAVGSDETGDRLEEILHGLGIGTSLPRKDIPTGVSAIAVTPDHERTMFTYLGACRDFRETDLDLAALRSSRFFYSTGYMWDTKPQERALFAAVDEARAAGIPVCFDLADPFVVDRYHERLREWLPGRVDCLFANRQELARLSECSGNDAEIIRAAARMAPLIAMKIGKGGCVILSDGKLVHVPGETVTCKDTTGAGDSFAAGFIYGLLDGRTPQTCGRLGNRIASRIVAVEGCRYDLLDREDILSILD